MVVGEVVGAFGVHGEMKVDLRTDYPDRFAGMERVYLGAARREYAVGGTRRHQGRLLLTLAGIDSREAAGRLRGQELVIPRDEAIPLPPGHFYLEDVLGASVRVIDGRELGNVTDVLRTGSNEVFVVGTKPNEVLIPSIRDAIRELDLEGGTIIVESWVVDATD